MTKRQGVFPPEGTNDGTGHWIIDRNGVTGLFRWGAGLWSLPHYRSAFQPITLRNCQYLGPAPTYEQAQADAVDARRFRWVASLDHGGTREIRLSGVKRNGDAWSHGISWNRTSDHADIRAAIDAEMKEQGNA